MLLYGLSLNQHKVLSMQQLQLMIKDSTLTRLLATIFLFTIIMGSSFIVGYELFLGQVANNWLVGILGVAIGSSIKILGISAGIAFTKEENV